MAARLPKGCYRGDGHDAEIVLVGRAFRRYAGIWCAETAEPGIWRSARWLGLVDVDTLIDHIHAQQHPNSAPLGQLEMELA